MMLAAWVSLVFPVVSGVFQIHHYAKIRGLRVDPYLDHLYYQYQEFRQNSSLTFNVRNLQERYSRYVHSIHPSQLTRLPYGLLSRPLLFHSSFSRIDSFSRPLYCSLSQASLNDSFITYLKIFRVPFDVNCLKLYRESNLVDCHLPDYCVDVKIVFEPRFDVSICFGYQLSDLQVLPVSGLSFVQHPVGYTLQSGFQYFCNLTTGYLHLFPANILSYLQVFEPWQYMFNVTSDQFVFDSSQYDMYLKVLDSAFSVLKVSVFRPIHYVCNDTLYSRAKYIDYINVFPSPRDCDHYMILNLDSGYCVDYLFDANERCPDDFYRKPFRLSYLSNNRFSLVSLSVREMSSYSEIVDYTINRVEDLIKKYDLVGVFRQIRGSLDKIWRTHEVVFGFNSFWKPAIDYFFSKIIPSNVTVLSVQGQHVLGVGFADWLVSVFASLIRPFWDVMLEVLQQAVDIILDVLLDVVPLLENFIRKFETVLEKAFQLVLKILTQFALLFINLFVYLERHVYLSEYLCLFVLFRSNLNSDVSAIILLVFSLFFFGFQRNFPSLFLLFLNSAFKPYLFVDSSQTFHTISFESFNSTHYLYTLNHPVYKNFSLYVYKLSIFDFILKVFSEPLFNDSLY